MEATKGIAVYSSRELEPLRLDKRDMLSHNTEETLHSYLRRHFEQVSRRRAGQFLEPSKAAEAELALATVPAVTKGS